MILDHVSGETVTDVRLILVDESGRLWRWCSADGSNTPVHLIDLSIEDTRKYSLSKDMRHWRLAHSGLVGVLYVISGRSIGRVDLREESPSCEIIFQLHPNDGILTSITPTAIDFILCAATTTKLLWIDTSSGKTVAAWRHDRQSEPGLNVAWMPGSTHLEVCLYSSRNNWVSVYSMRWSEDQQSETGVRVRVHATSNVPRSFLLSSSQNASRQRPRKGFQLFRHPLQDPREDRSFDVFELTSGHAVFRTRVSDAPSPSDPKEALRVWSEEVHAMQAGIEEAERSGSKYGPLGLRESQTYDLRSLYQRDTVLHSEEGYEALHDACETDAVPPTEAIAQNTAWSWNIGETLDSICGGTVPIPSKLQDLAQGRYREFDVLEDDMHDKDAALLDREYTSARMLAVDLAMSLDVFSTRSVQATESQSASKRVGIVDAPYMMMSKTSIDADELPPINFSFLTPRSNPLRATIQEKSSKKKKRRRRLPDPDEDPEQGARLLLSGWKIGDDPQGVCYVNPYDNNAESSKQSAHSSVKAVVPVMETARKMVVPGIQISSLPHTTGRSSDAPSLRNAEPTSAVHESHSVFASQPEPRHGREWATQPPDAFGDSPTPQTMWSSTQPISGLFGTRPASSGAAKKKKRVGGF
ncbi:hypothetical protein FRB90_009658 [Tulasnella sp. 427]|nr:hypothetical protein FRB90_009658 [Tulasnella sp. 427]